MKDYQTIDDFDFNGKTILCRLDLNSPMSPDGKILDDKRFRSHLATLRELEDASVVVLAHQSRPGKSDFTTLEPHSKRLSRLLKREVEYIDEIFGSCALKKIKELETGGVLMLENVRFYSEETLKRTPKEHAATHMVRRLAPLASYFINDAFSVSHRPHLSVTGFTQVLPSLAGRVMEKEITSLARGLDGEKPCVYVLGGTKVDDSIRVIEHVISRGSADKILVTGVVANVFLAAKGVKIGQVNLDFIEKEGYTGEIEKARKLLEAYSDKIVLPIDLALEENGKRIEAPIEELKNLPIQDIGIETTIAYAEEIKKAATLIMNGPAGVFEKDEFSLGTHELLLAAMEAKFSVVGGGHIAAATEKLGFSDKISHISTGGGACIDFLAGKKLPGIEALKTHKTK